MSSDTPIRAAIFDGDDTLWRTEILYDQARDAAREIVLHHGGDPQLWEARQRVIDVENVAVYGFSSARFPASCLQAFQEIRDGVGQQIDDNIGREIIYAAQSVFRKNPELFPHVVEVLDTLRFRGVRLALLTKGDPQVQADRIERSGLAPFFEVIEIVAEKTTSTVRNVLDKLNASIPTTWIIGNSLRSDILPALTLGIRGIWIDAPVWEYEKTEAYFPDALVTKAPDIRRVLDIIK